MHSPWFKSVMFFCRSARRQSFFTHQDRHPRQHRVAPDKVELQPEGLLHSRVDRVPGGELQKSSSGDFGLKRPLVDHAQVQSPVIHPRNREGDDLHSYILPFQSHVHTQLPSTVDRVAVERGEVSGDRLRRDARQAPRPRRQERVLRSYQEITQQGRGHWTCNKLRDQTSIVSYWVDFVTIGSTELRCLLCHCRCTLLDALGLPKECPERDQQRFFQSKMVPALAEYLDAMEAAVAVSIHLLHENGVDSQ